MLTLLDRRMIRAFIKGYLVCLTSLLSLYIVVDLFTNLDEFGRHEGGLFGLARLVGLYYATKVPEIFDRLFEAILLMSAMFTVAWMQRNNEQLPLLSAGVSTRRIVRPVLISAGLMLSLMMYNQEVLIPELGDRLHFQRDDPDGEKAVTVHGAYEPNGIHISGHSADRPTMTVRQFCCTIPEKLAGALLHLEAAEAQYVPPGVSPRTGGWELRHVRTLGRDAEKITRWDRPVLEKIDPQKYFLYTRRVNFREITRNRKWFLRTSTKQLYGDLHEPDSERLSSKAVLFHMRFTRPILSLILVLLGLAVLLKDQNRNIFISAGLCLIMCAVFFAANYACKMLGDNDYISPALAAWLPVLLFGPIALVKFDAVHT